MFSHNKNRHQSRMYRVYLRGRITHKRTPMYSCNRCKSTNIMHCTCFTSFVNYNDIPDQ